MSFKYIHSNILKLQLNSNTFRFQIKKTNTIEILGLKMTIKEFNKVYFEKNDE